MKKNYLIIILCCCFSMVVNSQPVVAFSPVISSGISEPVDVVSAKDGTGRMFIVEQTGLIKIYSGGALLPTPFLNLSGIIGYTAGGERGLLSLAFHPGYSNASNGYFFVYYTAPGGAITVARYRRSTTNANIADPNSGQVIISIPHAANANHNGGKLNFGTDGNLYFGTGDGGGSGDVPNNAQTGTSNLGKMLRINVDNFAIITAPFYTIPANNPFVGDDGINDEIFALGLRNPWRWSFDRQTGDMWIADVGQNLWEEVNYRTPANMAGTNYGWRCYEATHPYNTTQCSATPATGKTMPIFEYPHDDQTGGYVITGGYVYRGTEFPDLQGYYICCDYANTHGWLMKPNGSGGANVLFQTNFPSSITSFGEGEDGSVYAVSSTGGGTMFKVVQSGILPVKLLSFSAIFQNGFDNIRWTSTIDPDLQKFEIERSADAARFASVGEQAPQSSGINASYEYRAAISSTEDRFYRLKMIYRTGSVQYSNIVRLNSTPNQAPTVIYSGAQQIQLVTPYALKQVNIVNNSGQKLKTYSDIPAGSQMLQTGNIPAGMYWVQCVGEKTENLKFVVW